MVYGLIVFLSCWYNIDLLVDIELFNILNYLSECGSVDGVIYKNEFIEDGLYVMYG